MEHIAAGNCTGRPRLEILDLAPGLLGVAVAAIYVVDDEGRVVVAGPFESSREAVRWIERTAPERAASANPADA